MTVSVCAAAAPGSAKNVLLSKLGSGKRKKRRRRRSASRRRERDSCSINLRSIVTTDDPLCMRLRTFRAECGSVGQRAPVRSPQQSKHSAWLSTTSRTLCTSRRRVVGSHVQARVLHSSFCSRERTPRLGLIQDIANEHQQSREQPKRVDQG